ncbi:MerR family transcriptional regulator, partial [Bacillus wiedmannii]|uniref:MerR family transcriptional regulator n=1 Tax=Bacillus wiedmannii TaxID=1890302 RepID=UPI0021D07730
MKTLYSPGDVAEQLGIQSSTLRKYADVLEKEGYTFIKNERGHRKYRESDVMVFRKVINLKNDTDMTLENATKQIVSWHQGVEVLPLERHEVERYEEPDFNATPLQAMIQDQKEVIEKQNYLLQELNKRLAEQDQRFAQRESELLSAIQSIQDSQKLIATNSGEDIAKNQGRDEMLMQTIR